MKDNVQSVSVCVFSASIVSSVGGTLPTILIFYSFPTRHRFNDESLTISYHAPIRDLSSSSLYMELLLLLCTTNAHVYDAALLEISFRITNVSTVMNAPSLTFIWI